MKDNLAVYYSGASGGCFFALTLALATQDTHSISSTKTVQEIIRDNWKIDDYVNWDDHQVAYDYSYAPWNRDCTGLSAERCKELSFKVFTVKNHKKRINNKLAIIKYDDFKEIVDEDAVSIMVYTDVDTQFALMELKQRGVFCEKTSSFRYAMKWIKEAGFSEPAENDWHDIFKSSCSEIYNGIKIFSNNIKHVVLDGIDHEFLLQDVVNTKFKCVTDALGIEYTKEVADHVDFWVALHPKNIQQMLIKGE
jgi:hypothetical protein